MNFGKALFDSTQHALVPVNFQVGMQAALHQYTSAAEFDGLADLLVNRVELENVSLFRLRSFQRTIKRAEGAIFCTKVGVVDVAVDDVSRHTFRMELAPHGIGFHADSDQVVGIVEVESLLLGKRHDRQIILLHDLSFRTASSREESAFPQA